jgi:hydroxypyruvate isomerase
MKRTHSSLIKDFGMPRPLSRRDLFSTTAGVFAAGSVAALASPSTAADTTPAAEFKVKHGRIRQSVMGWCFNPMPTPELAQHCRDIGLVAMEGIGAEHYPAVRKLGLKISLVSSHGFAKGPFNRDNHELCLAKLRSGIDLAVANDCQNVITFTGMREKGITDEQGTKNCLELWKQVIGYAEEKQVNLCLEHLNSRDNTHPMKGHPGYFGDDVDMCVDLIKQVDSPRMKLLFDIYHVQIMNGDVIRRLRQYKDVIAHIHTAGNPGRCELDDKQEINYPAVMQAILDIGYTGYVAQEFIPTWPDKIAALRHAAQVCDV